MTTLIVSLAILAALIVLAVALDHWRANRPRRMMRWAVRHVRSMTPLQREIFLQMRRLGRMFELFRIAFLDLITPVLREISARLAEINPRRAA